MPKTDTNVVCMGVSPFTPSTFSVETYSGFSGDLTSAPFSLMHLHLSSLIIFTLYCTTFITEIELKNYASVNEGFKNDEVCCFKRNM